MIYGEGVKVTVNGIDISDVIVSATVDDSVMSSFVDRSPIGTPRGYPIEVEGSFECQSADFYTLVRAMMDSRSRYWKRRHQRSVAQWRRRFARKLGVSYQEARHFCRTGQWP